MRTLAVNFPIQKPISGGEVDFHMHTSASDGHYLGKQLVDLMRMSGVGVAAITDHDECASTRDAELWRYLDALGEDAPQIVPGVEITAALPARLLDGGEQEVHIIGLGVNTNSPALRKALIRQRLGVDARVKDCIARLNVAGFDITLGEVTRVSSRERMITRADIGRTLVASKQCDSFREAMEVVESHVADYRALVGKDGEIQRFTMDPEDAIRLIHDAGGIAILAHPHRVVPNHDSELLRGLFADLRAKGLDAAEVYRYDLANEREPAYRALIEEAGLLPSGGSDFHHFNQRGSGRYPGDSDTPAEVWPAMAALIRENGGLLDVRELRVNAHPQGNAAEQLRFTPVRAGA